ncbi:MAG: hypothetical protein R3C17_07040 [Planctomycetaceae bacterium]
MHHNPTAGPADGEWMYGHNWVSLCFLATHPLWGVIALPLCSQLYVREKGRASAGREIRLEIPHKTGIGRGSRDVVFGNLFVRWASNAKSGSSPMALMRMSGVEAADRSGSCHLQSIAEGRSVCLICLLRKPGKLGTNRIYGFHRIRLAKRVLLQTDGNRSHITVAVNR